MAVGAFQGWLVAYRALPAFVVTLAGYLMFRGAAFLVADGQTLAPLSHRPTSASAAASTDRSASGRAWCSGCWPRLGRAWHIWAGGVTTRRYGIELAPLWVDALKGVLMCAAIAGFVWTMCLAPDSRTWTKPASREARASACRC